MKKYKHTKSEKLKKELVYSDDTRKSENHKTVEFIYGEKYPAFGGSLGVSYDKTSGEITKKHRADSVE